MIRTTWASGEAQGGAPRFAPGLALDYIARHALDFWLTTEDLPHPDNRVTVDRRGNIHLDKSYGDTEPRRRLLAKLKALLGPIVPSDDNSALVGAQPADPACWHRPQLRHRAVRHRPSALRA